MRDRSNGPLYDTGDIVNAPGSIWHGAEVIAAITRAQLLASGQLIDAAAGDLAEITRRFFKLPVAMTAGVKARLEEAANRSGGGASVRGLWWDLMVASAVVARRNGSSSTVRVRISLPTAPGQVADQVFKLSAGGGDQGEPVITVLLPDED